MFDVRGEFQLHQSNGATVDLHVDQLFPSGSDNLPDSASEVLRGRAHVRGSNQISTAMTGRVLGNQFFLVVTWNQGSVGEYHGAFNSGRLAGNTFDRSHPQSQASWFIDKDFRHF
jgi:hypothetical protein